MGRMKTASQPPSVVEGRLPQAIKLLKRAYKYLEGGERARTGWVALGGRRVVLAGIFGTVIAACTGSPPVEPIPDPVSGLTITWGKAPPVNWNATTLGSDPVNGIGPVLRVRATPSVPSTDTLPSDTLKLVIVLKNKDNGSTREGNFALIPAKQTGTTVELDIGGNFEDASFGGHEIWVKGTITRNGSAIRNGESQHYDITKYSRSSFSTVGVEYDHQLSNNVIDPFPGTSQKISEAFGAGAKKFNFVKNETTLVDSVLRLGNPPDFQQLFRVFVGGHRNQRSNPVYLAGVENLDFNVGRDTGYTGLSLLYSDFYGGTLIFLEFIYHTSANRHVIPGLLVPKTLTHELGHQIADLNEPQDNSTAQRDHNSPFCVMNRDYDYVGDNDDDSGNDYTPMKRTFFQNPFFCGKDVQKVWNASP